MGIEGDKPQNSTFVKKQEVESSQTDILEARRHIPELRIQLLDIMTAHIPKPQYMMDYEKVEPNKDNNSLYFFKPKEQEELFWKSVFGKIEDKAKKYTLEFNLPTDKDEKPIAIAVASWGYPTPEVKFFAIEVSDDSDKLVIEEGRAFVKPKKRKTIQGYDSLGRIVDIEDPKSFHEMTMEDFEKYSSLLKKIKPLKPSTSRSDLLKLRKGHASKLGVKA